MNLRHILLKPKVSPMDMYKAHAFIDSVRTLILNDSLTFEEAAGKFSEDKETNKNEGLMINPLTGNSIFENEQINPSIAYAIKNLKAGEITKAFKTKDNRAQDVYKIVKIKEIIPPHIASIDKDYQLIQNICLASKKQKFIDSWIKKKQASTYIKLEDDYKDCPFEHPGWLK
jgi:peptidyl-prolyl cis-trans isomerase SurA